MSAHLTDADYFDAANAYDSEQIDWLRPVLILDCDCGHSHAYWLRVNGKTYCAGCLNDAESWDGEVFA